MKLYLIRHGVTEQNKKRCLQGRSDIELNEDGRELARKTAEGLKNVNFDFIFTSPLKRAFETAEIIRGERNIPLIPREELLEISFGTYEGLCFGQEHYNIPDTDFMNFFHKPQEYTTPPEGESFEQVIARTGVFLQELKASPQYQDKTILLSTHGCALKAILANITKVSIADFWGEGVHKNCAVSLVELQDNEFVLVEEGRVYYS
ncbi:MAG: histidine phosphatase family protein [Lachnospiraceae bacterium]|nr:histidine phosphatase family protein [Lachnospiraceae bacterium]